MVMPRSAPAIARYEREKAEQRRLRREAVEMRSGGFSFRQIAEHQRCTPTTALNRYNKGQATYIPQELIESTRTTELDRFDALTLMSMNLLDKAFAAGDVDAVCKLQDKVLAVHDRRKKMVPIEVPVTLVIDQKVEHTTPQDRELADLLGQAAADVEDKMRWLTENAG